MVLPVAVDGGDGYRRADCVLARREHRRRGSRRSTALLLRAATARDVAVDPAGAHAAVVEADEASFFASLAGRITIAECWAPWCGPCESLRPLFDQQAIEHTTDTLRFVRVNVDDNLGVAAALNFMSIPMIVAFDADGHEIDREVGVPSRRRMEQLVRQASAFAETARGRGVA